MQRLPALNTLRCFEATARLGSVTLAAAELCVSHSAVSQQIKQLEEHLGVALFERSGRRIMVSENGRLYALQVGHHLAELNAATRQLRRAPRSPSLTLSTLPSFGQHWLLPRLPRFRARHPDYRLVLQVALGLHEAAIAGADLSVRMGLGEWQGMTSQKLFEDRWVMVCAPHFNGGRLPERAEEIVRAPRIESAEPWSAWCQAAGVETPPPGGLAINDSNLILEALRLGYGVALERLSLVAGALARAELVRLSEIEVSYPYPYWLVWPRGRGDSPDCRALRAWIEAEVEDYLASLAAG
ncbi:LysR substrate-binding domain-containing protein [Halotalea alkalilenta]|uniref:LysR substrate-binding domain-containing protein n=1 Tax=Halotalea alkalilenta TaxID=376489 RepID=UPI000487F8DB|nr:LysR substrate-binding domain-containing protein [Halotalea alkalilenta]